jgi:hypothetical protein
MEASNISTPPVPQDDIGFCRREAAFDSTALR